jgi:hypothetical protein
MIHICQCPRTYCRMHRAWALGLAWRLMLTLGIDIELSLRNWHES